MTEYEKERELYGIAALLSLSEDLFPSMLALNAVMKEVIKASMEVLEFRKRGGKALEAKLDPSDSNAMAGSADDDDDNEDEEVVWCNIVLGRCRRSKRYTVRFSF